jgi:hypothetical protein
MVVLLDGSSLPDRYPSRLRSIPDGVVDAQPGGQRAAPAPASKPARFTGRVALGLDAV